MKARTLLCCLVSRLALPLLVYSQGVGASGDIRGTIRDTSGAIMQNVAVAVVDAGRGVRRTTTTDTAGQFRVPSLPPAVYDVSVAMPGFETQIQRNVVLNLGETLVVDFRMTVSAGQEIVEVTSEPPVVDTAKGSQAGVVEQRLIQGWPINQRGILTFTLITPFASNSNTIADNADFRVKQTPQSGVSFYGSNGRGTNFTVDGGESNDDTGGVRLNVSQDVVQEFEINLGNYAAELGSASGASVNIVTKSGSNHVHGTVYSFFRADAMDARDPFAFSPALQPGQFSLNSSGTPVKNSLSRQQFGATLSFPIVKNKTFLFAGYEGLRSDAEDSVPLLTKSRIFSPTAAQLPIIEALANDPGNPLVPCISHFPSGPPTLLPAATCAFGLQSILTVDPTTGANPFVSPEKLALNRFIVDQFEKDGGLFPFPTRQHNGSVRLDHRFNNSNQASLRYGFAHLAESGPDVQALIAFSRGTSVLNWDSTLQGAWFHQFSAGALNEARLQWNWYQFNVDTNDRGGPGLDVQGYGYFGRSIFLPSHTTARRYEFNDNLTLNRGHHTMTMGFYELLRGNNTTSETFFAGRFEFLDLPGIVLSNCLQFPSAPIANGGCALPSSLAPAAISTLQSWSLGAPAFYEQGFGDPRYVETRPFTAAYWQDSWQVRSGLTLNYGLRYEVDSQAGILDTYKKNFAPRFSFAWDPTNDHKTVVRGGYGIFYSPIYAQIPDVVKTLGNHDDFRQIANTLVTIQGVPPANSAEIFDAMLGQGRILCGTPPPGRNTCITQSDLAPFVSVSNSGPLPPGTVLFSGQPNYRNPQAQQASFGIERQIGSGTSVSANYIYVHTAHLPWAVDKNLLPGAPIVSGPGANGLPTNGLPFQDWEAPLCMTNPGQCFADPSHTILQNNEYESVANAVYHGGTFQLLKRFGGHFSVLANYTYSKAIDDATDFNSDYSAFNEVDLAAERSRSGFDQRHKVVFAGVVESPAQRSRLLSGFELSWVMSYNSGHPFNLLAGADINGDNHFTNDRPPGAPRNSGLGPNYATVDVRLTRKFRLSESATLQFTAEAFNIANRTNYSRVNNVVGADFAPPFNVQGSAGLSPSQALAYTAALPRREIQLGLRVNF